MTAPVPETIERALYTVAQFCARNNIGRTQFYELVKAGTLEVVKVGVRTMVMAASERAWHESLKGPPSPTNRPTNVTRIRADTRRMPTNNNAH